MERSSARLLTDLKEGMAHAKKWLAPGVRYRSLHESRPHTPPRARREGRPAHKELWVHEETCVRRSADEMRGRERLRRVHADGRSWTACVDTVLWTRGELRNCDLSGQRSI